MLYVKQNVLNTLTYYLPVNWFDSGSYMRTTLAFIGLIRLRLIYNNYVISIIFAGFVGFYLKSWFGLKILVTRKPEDFNWRNCINQFYEKFLRNQKKIQFN